MIKLFEATRGDQLHPKIIDGLPSYLLNFFEEKYLPEKKKKTTAFFRPLKAMMAGEDETRLPFGFRSLKCNIPMPWRQK